MAGFCGCHPQERSRSRGRRQKAADKKKRGSSARGAAEGNKGQRRAEKKKKIFPTLEKCPPHRGDISKREKQGREKYKGEWKLTAPDECEHEALGRGSPFSP